MGSHFPPVFIVKQKMSLSQRVFSDALRDMQRAMAVFDQPFFHNARRSLLNEGLHSGYRYPASDMVETPNAYELSAELPGYTKDNIKIELADSRTLVLSGSMEEQHETKPSVTEQKEDTTTKQEAGQELVHKDEKDQQLARQTEAPQYWVKERVSGSFSRSFSFPTPINPDTIKASFENGVLKVTIPKTTENQARQINID